MTWCNNNHLKLSITGLFMLSCWLMLNGCVQPAGSTEKEKEIITEMSTARAKAFNEGNAAAIANYFAEDGLLMAPGSPAKKGKPGVQAYYQSIFDEYRTRLESHYETVEVSGRIAYGRGFAKVTLYPKKGGDSIVSTAKYLNILEKQTDGTWKTTHDIWNDNGQ